MVLGRPSCSWSGDQHLIPHAGGQHHNLRYLPYQTTGTANSYQPPSCSFPEGDFRSPATPNIIPRSAELQHNLRYLPYQTTGPINSYQPPSCSFPKGDFKSPATSNIIPRSAGQQHNLRYLPNQTTGPTNSYQPQSGSYPEGDFILQHHDTDFLPLASKIESMDTIELVKDLLSMLAKCKIS